MDQDWGPPPAGQPPTGHQPPSFGPPASNGKAIAALVLGIIGLCGSIVGIFGLIFSVPAIVLAVLARKDAEQHGTPSGMATTGLVLGIIGAVLAVVVIIVGFLFLDEICALQPENPACP